MKYRFVILFNVIFGVVCCSQQPALAKTKLPESTLNVLVQRGIIFDPSRYLYGCTSSIVGILTPDDSAFCLDNAEIAAVFKIDDFYGVVTRNDFDEFITYSNLSSTPYKKGDRLQRGSYVGKIGKPDDEDEIGNQLDIIVMLPRSAEEIEKRKKPGKRLGVIDRYKDLLHDECVRYIFNKMENSCGSNSATAL